mmetsp:Transcript_8193/g.23541  ORF Transcript_8193/g.23541 Transcript_8193/m.23541 type:complete len:315 (+) Transcript_8193:419-1363(+)|eukprot:CAMPEP_0119561568 /NCGR_PEP_ID=MMETSP1352-20130426/17989_1 /TAXON_ID=265584 /ORGANISM="Stauroneis constricta, Strain CCMP1120" /LENGTH=314 /DNA_ID=CAMNT_0007609797 /DNA_START=407 /DNA_END=1351 /DNA_ORIENTATION=-
MAEPSPDSSSACTASNGHPPLQQQQLPQHFRCISCELPPPQRGIMKKHQHSSSSCKKADSRDAAATPKTKSVSFLGPQHPPSQQQQHGQQGGETALGTAAPAFRPCEDETTHSSGVHTEVHEIERWQDMSEQEHADVWFSRLEFDCIKRSYREIIARMRNKEILRDTDDVSTRGLECRSGAGSKRRRDAQINGLMAVLCEQDRQHKEQVNDPETLAAVYRQYSYHCQQAATNMGRRDEYAVMEFMQDLPRSFRVGMSEAMQMRLSLPTAPARRGLGLGGSPRYTARNGRIVGLGGPPTRKGSAVSAARRRAAAA